MLARQVAYGVLAVLFIVCASCRADSEPGDGDEQQPVTIPLDQIWALNMLGTRNVHDLEKNTPSAERLMRDIGDVLDFQTEGQTAKPAFTVAGVGLEALREARAVMVGKRDPQQTFAAGQELSVVFFSHEFGYYVHLQEVVMDGGTVTIKYRFVPHKTKELTRHFALIPIGKQDIGKVEVKLLRLPMEQHFVDAGFQETAQEWESRVVCGSSEFQVLPKTQN